MKKLMYVAFGAITSLFIFWLLQMTAQKELQAFHEGLWLHDQTLKTQIQTSSESVRRNSNDSIIPNLYAMCDAPAQAQLDVLLGQLNGELTNADLETLHTLFNRCAYIQSYQRLAHAIRLQGQVEDWKEFRIMRLQMNNENQSKISEELNEIDLWSEVASREVIISHNMQTLVNLQGQIIVELLLGNNQTSTSVQGILNRVAEVNETIASTRSEVNQIRQQILLLQE